MIVSSKELVASVPKARGELLHGSDVLLLIYLCAQNAQVLGNALDLWICRIAFVAYVAATLLFDVLPSEVVRTGKKLFGITFAWAWAFWSFAYLSPLWSISLSFSLNTTLINNALHIIPLTVLVPYKIETIGDADKYIKIILASYIYQFVTLVIKTPLTAWGSERIGEAIGVNPNTIGVTSALSVAIALYLANKSKRKRYFLLIPALIIIGLLSGSRKSIITLVVIFVTYIFVSSRGVQGGISVIATLVAILCLLYFVMTNEMLYSILGERLEGMLNAFFGGVGADESTLERLRFQSYAIEGFAESPMVGHGINSFAARMLEIGYSHVAYSHCNYTEILFCFGLTGMVLYYWIHAYMLFKGMKQVSSNRPEAALVITIIIAFLIIDYGKASYMDIVTTLILIVVFQLVVVIKRVGAAARAAGKTTSSCFDILDNT